MSVSGFSEASVVAGEFNTVAPTPVAGQKVPLQTDSAGNLLVNVAVSGSLTVKDASDVAPGTTAPPVVGVVAGKTNDATPQYQPIPEGAGGRSVIVEGVAGGVAQPVSESGNWNVNQAIGVAGFEKITDGTNTAAVKAASTAAAAADPSLVVALSPNSPVPTGTNTIGSVKVTDGTTVAGVIAGTTALKTDLSSVAGTATGTAAAGVQKVGIVGATGTALDSTAGVLDENIKNVGGNAVATAAAGVIKAGIVGNTGATVDSTVGAGTAPTNQVVAGEIYNSSAPAPTTGQAMALQSDSSGSQFVNTSRRSNSVVQATTISATGATTILAAGAANHFRDITDLIISVTPQATTASSFTATLSDGTNSYIFDLVAPVTTATPKNPFVINFRTPLKATSAATAWTLNLSATNTVHVTVVAVDQLAA